MYFPLNIPAGIVGGGTEYQAKGRWLDSNLVRWPDGSALGPILGWNVFSKSAVTGKGRAVIAWKDDSAARWVAVGTESHLYAISSDGTVFDITPSGFVTGNADETARIGFGCGPFGSYTYGDARPDTGDHIDATVWDLDLFGQNLIACSLADGKLYEWTPGDPAAVVITNAPTACAGVIVTPQRFVMATGAQGDPRKFQWSDEDNITTWAPSATNQAGDDDLKRGTLKCARVVIDQILMLTDLDAYIVSYAGLPFVYVPNQVGEDCGAISKRCLVSSGQVAAWWSKSGFWTYNGAAVPLACSLWDDIQLNLNSGQTTKITAFHNAKYSEFWWFYPSAASNENDSYVFWNYKYNHWGNGDLIRLSGTGPGIYAYPMAVGNDGYVYQHENGHSYDGVEPFARSGPFELGNGDYWADILGVIPDEKTAGDVSLNFRTRPYPNAAESILASITLNTTGKADVRFSARQFELVVTGSRNNDWRFGTARLDVQPDSPR